MTNETILVTGATGKVGLRLVPRLLSWRDGDEIRVLVRTAEAAERFEAAGAQAVVGDVTDAADRKRALDGVAVVVNGAAVLRGPRAGDAEVVHAVNRDAAVALAREGLQAGIRRFVQVSTNLVYGPGVGRPVREDDELRAEESGHYGTYPASKREAEERLRALSEESGLDVIALRLAFVYGDGDPHLVEVVPRFAARATHELLPMVHHADVAQSVHRAVRVLRPAGGYAAYNIAGDAASTAFEVYELAGRSWDLAAAEGRAVADPWFGVADTTLAHRELGFRPIYPTARSAWRDGAL